MLLLYIVALNFFFIACEDCGPLGFKATNLLRPQYWYFDIQEKCPNLPEDHFFNNRTIEAEDCRIYFNLCKSQPYQCSGAVCARYKKTVDFVTLLGSFKENSHPFQEFGKDKDDNTVPFKAEYVGEELQCKGGPAEVKTILNFYCNESVHWNVSIDNHHGGSISPQPLNITFDSVLCQFVIDFESSEACQHLPSNDSIVKKISYGSLILILFFPGVLLYFILGSLLNRFRGREGKDVIPHRAFWVDLPELIMDGFIFTMATITCRHEDRFSKEYTPVA